MAALGFQTCSKGHEPGLQVVTRTFNYPVLKGKKDNPVLRITLENVNAESLARSFSLRLSATNRVDVDSLRIYYTGPDSTFNDKVPFGHSVAARKKMTIQGQQGLRAGTNYFWVSCEPSPEADLLSILTLSLDRISLDDRKLFPVKKDGVPFVRTGVAVRKHWDDSVHTYRIPGLATTNIGTLLAIYDARRETRRDLQGHIDIGVSRSTDGGNTWEPMRIALDMGKWGGLAEKFNGVSDACILVDRNSNDIYIAGLWMHGVINADGMWVEGLTLDSREWNHQWRNRGSQPGFGVRETSQFLLTNSTDDGQSWSQPVNLTTMCKKQEWWLWAPAPGHGITMEDGTLVFPTQGRDETGLPFSNITYSQDGGETWNTSKPAYHNTTECMAVELSDGSIMLNMRDNRNRTEKGIRNGRAVATTFDLGHTWTEHETSHGALIECVCMASIHKHEYQDEQGNTQRLLLFSNPNSKYTRHKQTIKVSFDEGLTWPEEYWIELDEGRGSGYSCLTSLNQKTIGILYEGSQAHMTFQTIHIREFLNTLD